MNLMNKEMILLKGEIKVKLMMMLKLIRDQILNEDNNNKNNEINEDKNNKVQIENNINNNEENNLNINEENDLNENKTKPEEQIEIKYIIKMKIKIFQMI